MPARSAAMASSSELTAGTSTIGVFPTIHRSCFAKSSVPSESILEGPTIKASGRQLLHNARNGFRSLACRTSKPLRVNNPESMPLRAPILSITAIVGGVMVTPISSDAWLLMRKKGLLISSPAGIGPATSALLFDHPVDGDRMQMRPRPDDYFSPAVRRRRSRKNSAIGTNL